MRLFLSMLVTVLGAITGRTEPLRAEEAFVYPWRIQGRDFGIPGDCSYQTYEQCLASASGRNVYCDINPRVAFKQ